MRPTRSSGVELPSGADRSSRCSLRPLTGTFATCDGSIMKPFRFGVNVWSAGSGAEWMDKARRTEEPG